MYLTIFLPGKPKKVKPAAPKKDVKRLLNNKPAAKAPGSPRKEVNKAKAVTTLKKAAKTKSTGS